MSRHHTEAKHREEHERLRDEVEQLKRELVVWADLPAKVISQQEAIERLVAMNNQLIAGAEALRLMAERRSKALEIAKAAAISGIKTTYWSMGKDYLSKDEVAKFESEIAEALKETE